MFPFAFIFWKWVVNWGFRAFGSKLKIVILSRDELKFTQYCPLFMSNRAYGLDPNW